MKKVLLFFTITMLCFQSCKKETATMYDVIDTTDVAVDTSVTVIPEIDRKWEYDTSVDKMTSKTTKYAIITSNESLNLDFPYDGINYGHLSLRKKNGSLNIYIRIDKGQITGGYDNNYIKVRFDDDKAITFSYTEPQDSSSDLIFIDNEAKFLSKLRKSKKTLIAIPLFQNGSQVLEFNTANLVWN